jgi:hypothetical protein
VFLVDGNVLRRAIDLAGGSVDEPFQAAGAGSLAEIERPLNIRFHETGRRAVAVRNGDQRSQVEDDFRAAEQLHAQVRIADVAGDHTDVFQAGEFLQPAPVVERVVQGERRHFRAGCGEMLDQMGADEAIGASDDDAFVPPVHALSLMIAGGRDSAWIREESG